MSDRLGKERQLALIDPIVYADGFDCALRPEEIHKACRIPIDPEDLTTELAEAASGPSPLVCERSGFWTLPGRAELADQRPRRIAKAASMRRRAERIAAALSRFPFVRGLSVTGSLAAEDARSDADTDILVLVEPNRIATVFLIFATLSKVTRGRLFCPNYYLATDSLALDSRSYYTARELMQSRPLSGSALELIQSNPWVEDTFPNYEAPDPPRCSDRRSFLQLLIEAPLSGRAGERLERRLKRLAKRRLAKHHSRFGDRVPAEVIEELDTGRSLRFHGGPAASDAATAYELKLNELRSALGLENPDPHIAVAKDQPVRVGGQNLSQWGNIGDAEQ